MAAIAHGDKPRPDKYTADSVAVVNDPATGERLLAVIIEPQGKADGGKDVSWPVYVTTARKANRCPRAVLSGQLNTWFERALTATTASEVFD